MTPDEKRAAVVAAMAGEIGPGDTPKYWADVGVHPPPKPNTATGHWCGAIALWALHQATLVLSTMWRIGIGFIGPLGLPTTKSPKPGDVLYKNAPFQHHGIVESFDGTTLVSIEGNTPTVKRVVRTGDQLKGITFYSIEKLLGGPSSPVTPPKKQQQSPPVAGAEGSTGTPAVTAATTIPGSAGPGVLRGLDLSHYQKPSSIKWAELAKSHGFVILNATDGTKPDSSFLEHAKRALDVGLVVGAYLFFRPVHHVDDQVAAFGELVESAGMGPGWLVPAIDVEKNEKYDGAFTAQRYVDPVHAIAELWEGKWGKPLIYTNPSDWAVLGNPEWLSDYHLWLAHYTTGKAWTPPGVDWTIWQFTGTGRLPGVYAGDLDMNVARALPLIGVAAADTDRAPALIQPEVDWNEHTQARDAAVQESDE